MFVLAKLDTYGYGDGERLRAIYGPFATRDDAEVFEKRFDNLGLIGVEYRVNEIENIEREVEFLNGLGMGAA